MPTTPQPGFAWGSARDSPPNRRGPPGLIRNPRQTAQFQCLCAKVRVLLLQRSQLDPPFTAKLVMRATNCSRDQAKRALRTVRSKSKN